MSSSGIPLAMISNTLPNLIFTLILQNIICFIDGEIILIGSNLRLYLIEPLCHINKCININTNSWLLFSGSCKVPKSLLFHFPHIYKSNERLFTAYLGLVSSAYFYNMLLRSKETLLKSITLLLKFSQILLPGAPLL